MKFFKKNVKLIIAFIIGMLIASGMSVYATATYMASNVKYTKTGENVNDVGEALNDLYSKTTQINTNLNQADATASDILFGKKAYTKNGLITGTHKEGYVSDTYNHTANTPIRISLGFTPSKFLILTGDATRMYCICYDSDVSDKFYAGDTSSRVCKRYEFLYK